MTPSADRPEDPAITPSPGHPDVIRILAPNPGPMTLGGTNTYVVGSDPCWVIDPGSADPAHIDRIRAVAEARGGIEAIVLTHSHRDHTEGCDELGAPVVRGNATGIDERADLLAAMQAQSESVPAVKAQDQMPDSRVGPFRVIPTPGHAGDHVAFVAGGVCFCGDLILGEGSSIVPPRAGGGSLADYLVSLDRVEALGAELLAPGHGPWITDPAAKIAEYRSHRLDRERRLVDALDAGVDSRAELLARVWDDVKPELIAAAALAMQAHLEKLAGEGRKLPALTD